MVAKGTFLKLARLCFVFWCFGGAWVGRPHLKTGRSAREAVSPPISTKKININFGWGGYVVGRDGLGLKRGGVKWVTGIAELSWLIR